MSLPEPTKQQIKELGMCFTPPTLVKEMLDKLPIDVFTDRHRTFLDNSCGRGAFLVAVLQRKMAAGASHKQSLETIYGIELDQKNAEECRQRLLMGSSDPELKDIVNHHIICADALNPRHKGWNKVGYMWELPIENNFFEWAAAKPPKMGWKDYRKKRLAARR